MRPGDTTRVDVWSQGGGHAIIVTMTSLDFADMIVTFLALVGPQKVLLSFAQIARTLDTRSLRIVVIASAFASACIGAVCALTAPWLATFFHISAPALELASGLVFFIYAIGVILGFHFDGAEPAHAPRADADSARQQADAEANPRHPLTTGFRALLVPFVVSPLAVTAALEESLAATGWSGRWTVAGAFALVALIDAVCALVLAPVLQRTHESLLDVLSRLLGILLAAVGVQLFLDGLSTLRLLPGGH